MFLSCCSSDRCASNACVLVTMTLADNQTSEGALESRPTMKVWASVTAQTWIIDHKRTRIAAG